MREVDDQAIKDMFARLEEKSRSEERRLRWLAYAAVAGIGVFAVAAVAVFGHPPPPHTGAPVAYGRTPPDGGANSPRWINCGAYNRQVQPEEAVHSLEHGAVWITYRPGLSTDQVSQLHRFASQTYVIVSPYQNLSAPVIATAWHRRLRLSSASDPRLETFVRAFRLGSQAPERGGPCTAGIGAPQ